VPQFVTRVASVPVFIPHSPGHFVNRFPFVSQPGILIIDVPQVEVTTVTTQFIPTNGWPQPPNENPPTDLRLRRSGQLAPFDPTSLEVAERMLALAGIKKGDVVYDLGSGDGRMVTAAAKKYGVKAVGFEIDPGLVKLARENVRKQGVEKLVEIRQQNFMTADLSPATVVTLYLSYDGNLALRPRLMNQLKSGARVVSNTFDMGDWQAKIVESYRAATGDMHLLYYWEIAAPELELIECWSQMPEIEQYNVSAAEGEYFRSALTPHDGLDLRPHIFALVRERGWSLRELTRSRHSLEDIYVQVTRPEEEA
jgi:precorrin-6B methylase 2